MITRETDYAIRAAICLARRHGEPGAVSTAALSREMAIPYRFLRRIAARLVAAGLVASRRGRGGGLRLAREARRISLLDVIRATDPEAVVLNRCLSRAGGCSRSAYCGAHAALARTQKQLEKGLAAVTLAAVAKHEARRR